MTYYALANGYHINYEHNDHKKILAFYGKRDKITGKRRCPFRLWATWKTGEASFPIKSLNAEHRCARNFQCCSIVTYKWIAEKFGSMIR